MQELFKENAKPNNPVLVGGYLMKPVKVAGVKGPKGKVQWLSLVIKVAKRGDWNSKEKVFFFT